MKQPENAYPGMIFKTEDKTYMVKGLKPFTWMQVHNIHHKVTVKIKFIDRLRILFGAKVYVHCIVRTNIKAQVMHSRAPAYVGNNKHQQVIEQEVTQ